MNEDLYSGRQMLRALRGARTKGYDIDVILARAGLPPAAVVLDRVYNRQQFSLLLRSMTRAMRDELGGLCSRPIPPGSFAFMCRQIIYAPSLEHALITGLRDFRRHVPDFVPRLHIRGNLAEIRLHESRTLSSDVSRAAQAVFVHHTIQLCWWLVGERFDLKEIHFNLSLPSSALEQDTPVLRAPLQFGQPHTCFSFDARWLLAPIVQNADTLRTFLRQAPGSLLRLRADDGGLAERVLHCLRCNLGKPAISLADVARTLNTTEATLYRRLQQHGLRFQSMKDDLRRELAIEYLRTTVLTQADIAERLGYSDVATFCRAFKKWTGRSAGSFRPQMPGGNEERLGVATTI